MCISALVHGKTASRSGRAQAVSMATAHVSSPVVALCVTRLPLCWPLPPEPTRWCINVCVLTPCPTLQVVYFLNCRFIKMASFHPRVFKGNKWIYVATAITVGLMVRVY